MQMSKNVNNDVSMNPIIYMGSLWLSRTFFVQCHALGLGLGFFAGLGGGAE